MEDVITFLQFLQKLAHGRLIPIEQTEHLADILKVTLRNNLIHGVYDSLNELLEGQLNSNEQNSLFIDIIETTQKPKEKDTLTKLTEYLDKISEGKTKFKYSLDFKVPSKNREYLEIFKDLDQNYILKYVVIPDYSTHYTIPIKDLGKDTLNTLWEAIKDMNSNE